MTRGKNNKNKSGKGKGKGDEDPITSPTESGTSAAAETLIVGILMDQTTFVVGAVDDTNTRIGDVLPSLGLKLQNHVNTNFGLDLTISPGATIAGITNSPRDEPVADVLKRLPPKTMLTVLFPVVEKDRAVLAKHVKDMVVNERVRKIENTSTALPKKPRKVNQLDQICQRVEDLAKIVEVQASEITTLKSEVTTLKSENATLKSEITELKLGNATLKSENATLKSESATLKARVTALENENDELRRASIGDLEALRSLRRRILLDEARRIILAAWKPGNSKVRWHEFRAEHPSYAQVKTFITSSQVFLRPLTEEALQTILDTYADIRVKGNTVAHEEANEELIRDAVEHATLPEYVQLLTTIWESVYNKNFDKGR